MAAGSLDASLEDGGRAADAPEIPTWVMFVAGGLSVAVGAAALIWPKPTLLVVGVLFGVYLALWGAVALLIAVAGEGVPTGARILGVLVGLLGLLTGLVLMVRPGQSVLTIVWVLGFWWCVLGVMKLIRGIVVPGGRLWNLLWGVVGIAAGAILLAWPGIGLGTLVIVVSVSLILQGFLEIGLAAAVAGERK
ncbi:HdeD family acid-resistance protein [Baekduia sp.]|jgi:uncharacterized membrane protein HdeD (DUF308 family)|uniref:HdeD family acid-resistance protein n=1 Tax=Baekduia sp. TaxID=2600305 RepID=UPI002DFD127B|nr:DUF308 domain-containing protein [Baekduia sp.]